MGQIIADSSVVQRVYAPSDVPATLVPALVRDLSNVRQTLSYPSGAKWASVMYRLLPGATAATGQFVKIVVNAFSDTDAAGKLATDGASIVLTQGDEIVLTASQGDPIYRIDVIAAVAVGTEKTLLQVLAGV